jgi:hypothetical protein
MGKTFLPWPTTGRIQPRRAQMGIGRESEQDLMDRVLEQGVKPHAAEIAAIGLSGRFACLVFEPGDLHRKVVRTWGRTGEAVFPLSPEQVRVLASTDRAALRWFSIPPDESKIKVFLLVHEGTLLINYEPGHGWSVEPGSTDAGWLS